jgi:DNA-binding CsgD family transcriptional regulator
MGGAASQRENELVFDILDIAEPAFAVDDHHRIVAWNDSAERLLGVMAQDIIGAPCHQTLAEIGAADCPHCEGSPVAPHNSKRTLKRTLHNADEATCSPQRPQFFLATLTAHTTAGGTRIVHLLREFPQAEPAPHHPTNEASDPLSANTLHTSQSASGSKHPQPAMLTQREFEVLRLLGAGNSTAEIAGTLNITRVTARNHVNKVLDKLGANSRLQAVVIASQLHLI